MKAKNKKSVGTIAITDLRLWTAHYLVTNNSPRQTVYRTLTGIYNIDVSSLLIIPSS